MTVRSEDASVNTGAAGWPSYGQAFVAVRRIQNKLHCWAAADRGRRFDDLYNLVWDPTVLTVAWERVAGNIGRAPPGSTGPLWPGSSPGTEWRRSCTRSGISCGPGRSHRHRCGR